MADNRIISSDAFKIMAHGKFVEKYGAKILKVNFNIGSKKEPENKTLR